MATSRVSVHRTIHLELSEAEAIWLRARLQNHLDEGPEDPFDKTNREAIFSAIPSHLS